MSTKKTQANINAVGWRLICRPRPVEEKTQAGLIIPDSIKDLEQFAETILQVVDVGPDAYTGSRFNGNAWVKPGDWVMVPRHSGWRIMSKDEEFRVINDDEVLAIVDDPDKL